MARQALFPRVKAEVRLVRILTVCGGPSENWRYLKWEHLKAFCIQLWFDESQETLTPWLSAERGSSKVKSGVACRCNVLVLGCGTSTLHEQLLAEGGQPQ